MTANRALAAVNPAGLGVVILITLLWQAFVSLGVLTYNYFPAPTEVAAALGAVVSDGALVGDIAHTLTVTVMASVIAIVLGSAVGLGIGLLPGLAAYTTTSVDFLRTLPVTALIPVALLVWGPAMKTEVIVAVYSAIWFMILNTAGGVRGVHPRLFEVAAIFRLSRGEAVRKIVIPAAIPSILVGARLAVVAALVAAIIAEMLVNPEGLGWGLIASQRALRPARLWAYAVTIGLVGYALNLVLVQVVRHGVPGGSQREGQR